MFTYARQLFDYVNSCLCVHCEWRIASDSTDTLSQCHENYELVLYMLIDTAFHCYTLDQFVSCPFAGFEWRFLT